MSRYTSWFLYETTLILVRSRVCWQVRFGINFTKLNTELLLNSFHFSVRLTVGVTLSSLREIWTKFILDYLTPNYWKLKSRTLVSISLNVAFSMMMGSPWLTVHYAYYVFFRRSNSIHVILLFYTFLINCNLILIGMVIDWRVWTFWCDILVDSSLNILFTVGGMATFSLFCYVNYV